MSQSRIKDQDAAGCRTVEEVAARMMSLGGALDESGEIKKSAEAFGRWVARRGREAGVAWLHDSAVVSGPGRHHILAAMSHHPRGDEYLEKFGTAADVSGSSTI